MAKIWIYFMGGCKKCELSKKPIGRYLCTSEGYDIYDSEEWEERYIAVKGGN